MLAAKFQIVARLAATLKFLRDRILQRNFTPLGVSARECLGDKILRQSCGQNSKSKVKFRPLSLLRDYFVDPVKKLL